MKRLILASSSPRRYDLLKVAGLPFEVARPNIDETPHSNELPDQYVLRLSAEKAQAVAANCGDAIILSADTTVVESVQIIGKPENAADAAAMLRRLQNRPH